MKKENFVVEYNGQVLEVEYKILNKEIIYRVAFQDGSKIDLRLTNDTFPTWAEANGDVTERSIEIGNLIEDFEM